MVRFAPFIAVLVTLGATAGAPLRSSQPFENEEQGLRGGSSSGYRGGSSSGYRKDKYCDSIDCSYGYTLIHYASDVKCNNGKCKESQCCEKAFENDERGESSSGYRGGGISGYRKDKYCDSIDCPYGYTLIHYASDVKCNYGKCKESQCCEKDTNYCDSVDCSYGYTSIYNAGDVKCDYGKCKESQCCDKVCSSFHCPNYCTTKHDSDKIRCHSHGCTTDKCCNYD